MLYHPTTEASTANIVPGGVTRHGTIVITAIKDDTHVKIFEYVFSKYFAYLHANYLQSIDIFTGKPKAKSKSPIYVEHFYLKGDKIVVTIS